MSPRPFQVGDEVEFEIGISRPRWNFGYDSKGTSIWHIGKVIRVIEEVSEFEVKDDETGGTWMWPQVGHEDFDSNREGWIRLKKRKKATCRLVDKGGYYETVELEAP
jgi:hypothetical protein